MGVFENESDSSQDASYREHLDRNWQNGNTAFDDLLGKYNGLLDEYDAVNSRLDDAERDVNALKQHCDNIEDKHNEDIKAMQEQLDRLNHAIFGYGEFEINYQNPPEQRPDDYEVNYRKPLNTGQPTHEHNFIEIETEQDHKREKGL